MKILFYRLCLCLCRKNMLPHTIQTIRLHSIYFRQIEALELGSFRDSISGVLSFLGIEMAICSLTPPFRYDRTTKHQEENLSNHVFEAVVVELKN